MRVRRLSDLERTPSVEQAALPGDRAPDVVWEIMVETAVGRHVERRLLAAEDGKRGSDRLLRKALAEYATPGMGVKGAVPASFEDVVWGYFTAYPGRAVISGFVMWFDKEPARRLLDL